MEKFLACVKNFFSNVLSKLKEAAAALKKKLTEKENPESGEKKTVTQKVLTGVGIGLCAVFAFLLVCNLVIIIKGTVAPEKPPSVFGITPMVVLSGSMSGTAEDHIEVGDLVFINKADPDELKVGDIIAFMEGSTTVTHRIIRMDYDSDGSPRWITKGDANNKEDSRPVTAENLVGIYSFRIPGLGDVAMFLQQPVGMLLVIGLPCLAFIIYDIIRRQRSAVKQDAKTSEMEAELERLRRLVGGQEAEEETASVESEAAEAEETEIAEENEEEITTEETAAETEEAEYSDTVPAEDAQTDDVSENTAEEATESEDSSETESDSSDESDTAEGSESSEDAEETKADPAETDSKEEN